MNKNMMLKVLLLISFFAASLAGFVEPDVQTLRNEFKIDDIGNYKFAYQLSDHQEREEVGEVIPIDHETAELVVKGSYSYVGPDGVTYTVYYTADRNGFQPYGDHLPQSPDAGLSKPIVSQKIIYVQ